MRTSGWIGLIVIIIIILAGGALWWHFHTAAPAAPAVTQEATTTPAGTAYVPDNLLLGTDATTTLGTYLIGSNGMTLYTYANDADGVSNCTDNCAENWPPYLVQDASVLDRTEAGVTGQVGTITRADGGMQVTYDGKPLYFYKGDAMSGDANGQGVGGVWYVVAASSSAPVAE